MEKEAQHCQKANIQAEISNDGKLIFIRLDLSQPLCCSDCLKQYLLKFMAELDFKAMDKTEITPLH